MTPRPLVVAFLLTTPIPTMYKVAFCLASASAASAGVGGTPDEVEDEEDDDGPESESPGSGGKVAEDILQLRKLRG